MEENATSLKYRRKRNQESSQITALAKAQQIAFAPFTFQAVASLLDLGILEYIDKTPNTIFEISKKCDVSEYTVKALFDMAELSGLVREKDGKYTTTKLSQTFLYDEMTKVNFNFMKDVCYLGASELKDSFKEGQPLGLKKFFGDYPTIYPALTILPEKVQKSWYEFDHFYSDGCFEEALKIMFKHSPEKIFDIGGNTGKFEKACLAYNEECTVTMLDLPENIKAAKENIRSSRCNFYPIDVISPDVVFPRFSDAVLMSQFLDCFSEEQVISILSNVNKNMENNTRVYILEPFVDNQEFKGAAFSLAHISLYFTCMANGNSKMYKKTDMEQFINKSGLKIEAEYRISSHDYTLLECVKA